MTDSKSPGWRAALAGVAVLALAGCGRSPLAVTGAPTSAAGQLAPPPPVAEAVVRHRLSIVRHVQTPLSSDEADRIMADSGALLGAIDGEGDVACAAALDRDGDVGAFDVGDGAINSLEDFAAVAALPGNVKVVDALNWCGVLTPNVIGCAPLNGDSMVVARFSPAFEGQLWAHEFGHNAGLRHVEREHALMRSFIGETHRRVDPAECDAFLSGAGGSGANGALLASDGRVQVAQLDGVEALTDAVESETPPVETFVRRIYLHGVPYAEAQRYSAADADRLKPLLGDPDWAPYWANIAVTIGIIGDKSAAETLVAFIEDPSIEGIETRRAKTSALMAMGYLVNNADSRTALAYLVSGLDAESWARAPDPDMASPEMARRDADYAQHCVLGLALSGAPEAMAALERQRRESELAQTRQRFVGPLSKPLDPELLEAAIATHAEVAEKGLAAYYREHMR